MKQYRSTLFVKCVILCLLSLLIGMIIMGVYIEISLSRRHRYDYRTVPVNPIDGNFITDDQAYFTDLILSSCLIVEGEVTKISVKDSDVTQSDVLLGITENKTLWYELDIKRTLFGDSETKVITYYHPNYKVHGATSPEVLYNVWGTTMPKEGDKVIAIFSKKSNDDYAELYGIPADEHSGDVYLSPTIFVKNEAVICGLTPEKARNFKEFAA